MEKKSEDDAFVEALAKAYEEAADEHLRMAEELMYVSAEADAILEDWYDEEEDDAK